MIYRGRLKPGDRLVETELAARLGLSHIPVRESLVRLTSEGLVRRVRNWATFVENFAADDALEIYAMRLALEPLATRMAAIRGGPRVAKRLQRLFDRMTIYREKQDHEKLDLADYRFHLTIVQASEVKRLIRAYEGCHIRCLSYLRGNNGEVNAYVREHQQIIKEIGAQRPDAAERVASDHVRGAMQRIEAALGTRFEDRPRS
jgi:DNA-binding GntR family transcriptional regulator